MTPQDKIEAIKATATDLQTQLSNLKDDCMKDLQPETEEEKQKVSDLFYALSAMHHALDVVIKQEVEFKIS